MRCVSPWYNCIGWLGIKHQLAYLLTSPRTSSHMWDCLQMTWYYNRKSSPKETPTYSIKTWINLNTGRKPARWLSMLTSATSWRSPEREACQRLLPPWPSSWKGQEGQVPQCGVDKRPQLGIPHPHHHSQSKQDQCIHLLKSERQSITVQTMC